MNKSIFRVAVIFLVMVFTAFTAGASVTVPQLIKDHMVLQRNMIIKIWGWASPGEKINVRFIGKRENTITGPDGKWLVRFPAMKEGGPYTMIIKGNNEIILTDILLGDVWFCSGQSNMALPMERLKEKYPGEIAGDSFPEIRNFFVPTKIEPTKQRDDLPPGKWVSAVGSGLLGFGGLTYFFARQLYQKYHIPIGIINASVGGSPIEAWMSADACREFPVLESQIKDFADTNYMNNLAIRQSMKNNNTYTSNGSDKGYTGPVKWTDPAFVPENWHGFWMPGYWSDQGIKELHGIVYFRKEIDVPVSMTGIPAMLYAGRIIDADSTFVNGKFVGNITYQYPPRRYKLPSGILKPGKNIIIIKVINTAGKGGFVPEKNYSLTANGQKIDLRGDWTYQVGQVFQPTATESNGLAEWNPLNAPGGLFNGMVAPAVQYAVKGFIWYQGESNCSNPKNYSKYLAALINDWRNKWNEGDIPFLYAQLPAFMEVAYSPSESEWAQLRQRQLEVLSLPNTGMAVTVDVGEWNDIHPLDKKDVGERLARWAEHLSYGSKDPDYSGPVYQSYQIEGNKIILRFNHLGSGFMVKGGGDLYYFSIAGADNKYVWAKAKIEGETIVVWSDEIPMPVAVRYAWADNPEGANLYNKKGLPASPFETNNK